jgi:ankyrin repeat protein
MNLLEACQTGNIAEVKRCLLEGQNPNQVNTSGFTPLHIISKSETLNENDAIQIARLLLIAGAEPNSKLIKTQRTPLHEAAAYGKKSLVELLLLANADVHNRDSVGLTPIARAAAFSGTGNEATIHLLKKWGADINALSNLDSATTGGGKQTPLHWAANEGLVDNMRALLEAGADIFIRTAKGASILDLSIEANAIVGFINSLGITNVTEQDIESITNEFLDSTMTTSTRFIPSSVECRQKIADLDEQIRNTLSESSRGSRADQTQSLVALRDLRSEKSHLERYGYQISEPPPRLSEEHIQRVDAILLNIKTAIDIQVGARQHINPSQMPSQPGLSTSATSSNSMNNAAPAAFFSR